jgi:hypothetical protein
LHQQERLGSAAKGGKLVARNILKAFAYQISSEARESYCRARCSWILKYFDQPKAKIRQYEKTHTHTGRNDGHWLDDNAPQPEPPPLYPELEPILSYLQIERDALEATAFHDEIESKGEVVAQIYAFGGGERGLNPGDVMRDPKRRHIDPILAAFDVAGSSS